MRVLVVEDELVLREGLRDLIAGDGHEVEVAVDGERGLAMGLAQSFEVVVLDLMLPKLDGIEVCRRLRSARPGLSILMLTARGDESDKVRGLTEGADDYVTKPFAAKELLARVRALGRRHLGGADAECISEGELSLNLSLLTGELSGTSFSLSAREVGVIRLLHRRRPNPVSRSELLEVVWGAKASMETRAVDMAIATLRKKIEASPKTPSLLCTVKGVGYAWQGKS